MESVVRIEQTPGQIVVLTEDDISTLVAANVIPQGTPAPVVKLFARFCSESRLSPFKRQVHLVGPRSGKFTIQTGIDGYRAIADRTGRYAGNDDPVFDDEAKPTKATVTVHKMIGGQRCAFTATARWSEYFPGDTQGFMWKKMPHLMLSKCAESLALRKAFPDELGGIYTDEEMEQADAGKGHKPSNGTPDESYVDQSEPSAPVTVAGASFDTFDPTKETVTFGKWSGSKWSEVPLDYIQWLAKGANKPDIKAKAEGTLSYLEHLNEQKPLEVDPFAETFDEKPVDPETLVLERSAKLRDAILTDIEDAKKPLGLNGVIKTCKDHYDAGDLTDDDADILRKAITARTAELSTPKVKK